MAVGSKPNQVCKGKYKLVVAYIKFRYYLYAMKTILLLLIPCFSFAQKEYHVAAFSVNSGMASLVSPYNIIKTNGDITVSDSTFTVNLKGQEEKSNIVEKVSDDFFKISNGLNDSTVKILNEKNGKYSGSVVVNSGQYTVIYFLKE